MSNPDWICCQIGAREHYSVPRSLHQVGHLHTLITDAWVSPSSPIHSLPGKVARSLSERYHSDLKRANVQSFTRRSISFELQQKLSRSTGWTNILARNQWFQHQSLGYLNALANQKATRENPISPTIFSYSYAALELFKFAKHQGWRTILGQIDPGIVEEQIVADLQAKYGQRYQSSWTPAPAMYWDRWRQECELADQIMVNSTWSQTALIKAGIAAKKIAIAPLAYQPPAAASEFRRTYPEQFSGDRPLRVLFLGQVILRKGIAALLEALPYIEKSPIEIWLVGPTDLTLPSSVSSHPQLKWLGAVPRSQVQHYYQKTDIFLFPTHSDGFGLTQLEAQAWHLPIIASEYCGSVVSHDQNGLILPSVSGKAIADALLDCCAHPQRLKHWADPSHTPETMNCYSLNQLAHTLQNICHAPV